MVHANDAAETIALYDAWLTFGPLLIGSKTLEAQDDCKLVLDAMTKLIDTPTHAYVTMNIGGTRQTGESIYAGGLVYANKHRIKKELEKFGISEQTLFPELDYQTKSIVQRFKGRYRRRRKV
jgi:hypothetical protein